MLKTFVFLLLFFNEMLWYFLNEVGAFFWCVRFQEWDLAAESVGFSLILKSSASTLLFILMGDFMAVMRLIDGRWCGQMVKLNILIEHFFVCVSFLSNQFFTYWYWASLLVV